LVTGLTTQYCKKQLVTETATEVTLQTGCDGLPESSDDTRMNGSGESLREATARKREVLSVKTKTRIGFWNVRTMYEVGKLAQVTTEMRRYNLHILGISESRWTGSGKIRSSTGETVIYSGREDNQHHEGVAIILKKGAEKSLMEWKPINSRLLKIRIKGKQINTTIIQCYAPTNDSDDEAKDEFYEQLQAELEAIPRHDMKIVMGDMNAKVGGSNNSYERALGREGCGTMNGNGEKLAEMCTSYDLVIGGTLFPHKEIHKLTWYSPNGRDKNQIDHFMINGTWRRSLMDVRVMRGADVGSDHQMVLAVVKLKLRKAGGQRQGRQAFDIEKLKNIQTRNTFVLKLKNKFQALSEMEDTMEQDQQDQQDQQNVNTRWQQVKTAYLQASQECLGPRDIKKKEWITANTWQVINTRRELKKKVIDAKSERLKERYAHQYQEANRDVKKLIRADKREYMDSLAKQAEEAAGQGDQGTVYRIIKTISGKYRGSTEAPVTDKQGRLLTSDAEIDTRWAEHFSEVLNRPPPTEEADIQEAEHDLEVDTAPPEKHEIISAIKAMKNRKAPGQDNLNAELFKADPDLAAELLLPLFSDVWEGKEVPTDWSEGIIIKIPKKGALNNCNNWRGITLLSIPSKILAKIIVQRLTDAVDKQLRQEQAGFRRGRGCTDQIFILRNIIEQCTEWQRHLYINFVDFEKAFDSIHRESLWRILRAYGVPQEIVLVIKSFYTNFTCKVGNSDHSFQVKTGVRQGCVMSSLLFIIAIDWVMRRTTEHQSTGIRWTLFSSLEDLDFADDLALVSHTHQHIQEKTSRLNRYAQQIGMKINVKKSEVMSLNIPNPQPVRVNGEDLPTAEEFTYLGSTVRHDGGAGSDIKRRIGKARNAFQMLNNVWRSQQYSTKTKTRLYQSCVLSTLLYGSECWRMTESDLNKLAVFHTKNLRRILRIFWPNTIANEDLLARCQQESMDNIIMRKRWRWIGHVLRKEANNNTRIALHWTPEGKRKRGRPKNTWRRTAETEMRQLTHTWGTIHRLAQNRQEWRSFVAALHAKGITGSK
jgi:hypothetical protein